jgi:HSP20 family protein
MRSDFNPRQQRQQQPMNALDPFLAALFAQLAHPETKVSEPEPKTTATRQEEKKRKAPVAAAAPKKNKPAPAPAPQPFSPRFDIFETEAHYHLIGDLPGVQDKKTISLEFSDERILFIRGRVDRKPLLLPTAAPAMEKRRSLNPTVEETDDEDDHSVVSGHSSHKEEPTEWVVEEKIQEQPQVKKWLSERSFGEFQRTFTFPTPVDLEKVSAKLENGLLEITVPKKVFTGTRRIQVE